MKMDKEQKTKAIGFSALAIFGLGAILAIAGLSKTINELDNKVISRTPDAILASAGINDGKEINLPVAYFDQKADPCVNLYDTTKTNELKKRQFEWSSCDYALKEVEQGLVEYYLNDKYLPVATAAGNLTANRGLNDFTRWFSGVTGKSQSYSGVIKLIYNNTDTTFSYENQAFYPLDESEFSAKDDVNSDGHNHLFTMNFAVPFNVLKSGGESFEITADDDTFVFIDKSLALDMGGVHNVLSGQIMIRDNGEVYTAVGDEEPAFSGISLADVEDSIIRIFHADRDSLDSVFNIKFTNMNLNVIETKLADNSDGIQIAYDPTDPSYIAPLGESSTATPDTTRGYIIMATTFGIVIIGLSILIVTFARHMLKSKI